MRSVCLLLTTMALVSGCASSRLVSASPSSGAPSSPVQYSRDATDTPGSLFPSDQAVLSNEAIEKILSSRFERPKAARVAVVRVGAPGHWWWSEDLALLDQSTVGRLVEQLEAAERIQSVSVLPSLLMPQRLSVPYVREAAARFQADLVLLYRSTSRVYEKQKFLAANEIRACCTVEAVLLDTRSGLVPFAALATETYTARQTRDDLTFAETMRKAELTATGRALDRIAAELIAFLDAAQGD